MARWGPHSTPPRRPRGHAASQCFRFRDRRAVVPAERYLLKEAREAGPPSGLDVALGAEGQVVDDEANDCSQHLCRDPGPIPGALKEKEPKAASEASTSLSPTLWGHGGMLAKLGEKTHA